MKRLDLRTTKLDNDNGTYTDMVCMTATIANNPKVDPVATMLDLGDLFSCVSFDEIGTAHFTVYTTEHGNMTLIDGTCVTIDNIVAKDDVISEKEYTLECVNEQGEIIDTSRFIEWLIECVNDFDIDHALIINYRKHGKSIFADGIMWDGFDNEIELWLDIELNDIATEIKDEIEYTPYNPFMEW